MAGHGITREGIRCTLIAVRPVHIRSWRLSGAVGATCITQASGGGSLPAGSGGAVDGDSPSRRLRAFRSLAGNRPLVRVVVAYALFMVTEYSVWLAMLVYAYRHGGATVAGLIAVAELVPAAVLAPFAAAVADRWSPVVLLAGGYLDYGRPPVRH